MSELEDLRRDVIELREWKAAIISKCKASDGFDALEWAGDKEGWGFIHYFIGHLETRALMPNVAQSSQVTPGAAVLKRCDDLHDLGFNAGWNGAIEEAAKVAEYNGWQRTAEQIRALAAQPLAAPVETMSMEMAGKVVHKLHGERDRAIREGLELEREVVRLRSEIAAHQQCSAVNVELEFEYCNWEGRKSIRRARPISIRFGKSEWHPKPQWLMLALDLDKEQEREFAMSDMEFMDEFPSSILTLAQPQPVGMRDAMIRGMQAAFDEVAEYLEQQNAGGFAAHIRRRSVSLSRPQRAT